MAEASAATLLDDRHFVVAEDECNTLLVYEAGRAEPVGQPIDVSWFLGTGDQASDIEGGAAVGDVVYWISSRGLPKSGTARDWRKQFFATKVSRSSTPPTLVAYGRPYAALLKDMVRAKKFRELNLAGAERIIPEDDGGLNIEGLAVWKDGGLLVGFRSPLVAGQAPVVPLKNPASVIQGSKAKFGRPILLGLGGRGVRSIDRVGDQYLIIAGPVGDGSTFALLRWSGNAAMSPVLVHDLPAGFSPEALVAVPGTGDVLLLSDDGASQPAATCGSSAKAQQRFRTIQVRLP